MMRRVLSSVFILAAIATGGCGKSSTPTAPSNAGTGAPASPSPTGPAAPSGATVMGHVQSAAQGTTIAVAGTSSSAVLDGSGGFSLNVSPGDVQLQVKSAAATATVAIQAVQPAQTVEVIVSVAGASATVESEVRHGAGEAELKGVVEALPPTTSASTFKAAGRTILTTASTVFVKGSVTRTFADLGLGNRVEVHGTLSGDTLTASRVEIEDHGVPTPAPTPAPGPGPSPGPNPPAPNPNAEVSGVVSALTGTASKFQFSIGSQIVNGTAATIIDGSGRAATTFADLKNGVRVEVKGTRNSDGSVQATRVHVEDANEQENEVELKGAIAGLTGTASLFQFTVNGTVVKGNSTTTFGGGDDAVADNSHASASFADLKNGVEVEVKGTRNTDSSVQASRIQLEDENENENEVESSGTMGAVTGACPSITSSVGTTPFTTSPSTRFDSACSSFASGQRVEVKGTRLANGSIAATRLARE